MRLLSNGLRGWKRSWKDDLRASISVAFIAIPLNLGIGLASGVPPLAAVIPCVVGGLLISWFSGGNIIVHSTPKMLIGVTAAAVITLGGDDLFLGYKLFLSVLVVAGAIQFILGLLRLGIIGDLIPATVIKSLLASVGFIIVAKQLPNLVGSSIEPRSIIELIPTVPSILADTNPLILLIGIVSMLIMFLHPRVDLPFIKAIPGAVWVVIIAIGYSYALEFAEGGTISAFGQEFSFGREHLILVPSEISQAIVFPDFSMIMTAPFWNLVLAVVIASSVEGILSTKAIDRLDPLKRKSNVNKELSAMGFGTSLSALVGGLPVIPGIVASSVGVNHNGKGQLMDAFQAMAILLLIVLLSSQLQHIPLAALAGILFHTGYKLINPKEIRNVYRIGWDQILIFGATLITTLTTDLMVGIGVGILLTLILHIIRLRSLVKLFNILFRPNVVSYEEEDKENTHHISVKGYSNFLNYPQLKKALDIIPRNASIMVDLSLAEFVDHTVMEHLAEYEESHVRKGGEFEIIGIDTHLTSATHPLSVRFRGNRKDSSDQQPLTSRQQKLQLLAKEIGWEFSPAMKRFVNEFEVFHLLRHKLVDTIYNRVSGQWQKASITILDMDIHEGEFQTKITGQTTVAVIDVPNKLPLFTIEKEHIFDKLAALAGYDDIDFDDFKRFSTMFKLKGEKEQEVLDYFTPEFVRFLETELPYRMESSGNQLLILGKERTMSVSEISDLISFCKQLINALPNKGS